MCLKASLFPDRMFKLRLVLPKNVVDKTVETITELGSYEPADVKSAFGENIEWARHDLLVVTDHITKLESFFEYFELSIIPEPDKTYKFKSWREAAQEAVKEAKEIEAEFEERMNKIREIETKMFEVSALLSKPHTLPEEMAKKLKEVAGLIALSEIPKDLQSDLTVLDAAAKELIKLTEEFVRQLALKILKELEEEKKIIFEDARAWAFENEEKIKHVYGLLKTVESALKVLAKGKETDHFVYLEGYVHESKLKRTLKKLEEIVKDNGFLVAHIVDMDKETPPTYVKVESEAVKTALNVENIYGAPNPRELVPALIMAFTLPFIYMFMFPDWGHALVLVLFGWGLVNRKNWALAVFKPFGVKRFTSGTDFLGKIMMLVGSASILTGWLAGEFFGPLIGESMVNPAMWLWKGLGMVPPLTFELHYLGDTVIKYVLLSITIGYFHLLLGHLIGIVNELRFERKWKAVHYVLPFMIMYLVAGAPFVAGFFASGCGANIQQMMYLSGKYFSEWMFDLKAGTIGPLMVIFILALLWRGYGIHLELVHEYGKSSGSMLGMELFENFLLVISNLVSYLRIMALALAHWGLVFAFQIIGELGGPVMLVVLYFLANVLVIMLEGLVSFIHDIRLHFYEWFTKFYVDRGRMFEPARQIVRVRIE